MNFNFTRKEINGHFINYYEDSHIILGFTEKDFKPEDLTTLFNNYRLTELKQIHSEIIHLSSRIETMKIPEKEPTMKGDGIILDEKRTMAVIKTADCTPLFFRDSNYTIGGVVHIGWQGLLKGIEAELINLLEKRLLSPQDLHIFLGPAIEKNCYEVGQDLYDKFGIKEYRDKIFFQKTGQKTGKKPLKYLMDVQAGISLSLEKLRIPVQRIDKSSLCTYCETERLPSYRRDKGNGDNDGRIYSFLALK